MDATAAAERSIPPVSMVSVWEAARMASGIASLTIVAAQLMVTNPGRINSKTTTRMISRPTSGITGESRISDRHPETVSHWLR